MRIGPRTAPSVASRWVTGILLIFTLLGLGFGSWLSRLPAVRDHVGATTFEMSVYGLCLAFGSLVGLMLSGRTISFLGSRRTLGGGILAQSIAMPVATTLIWNGALVPGLAILFCFGFAFSTSDVAMNVSGAAAERALGQPRLPLMHAGFSLGSVSAMGIGALAERWSIPVPVHLTTVFLLIIAIGGISLRLIPPDSATNTSGAAVAPTTQTGPIPSAGSPHSTGVPPSRRPHNPWRDPRILLIGLIAMSMSLAEGTAADWLPLALADGRGLANEVGALMLGIFYVSMTITRLMGSMILGHLGRVPVLRGGAIVCGVGVVLVILIPFTWGIVLGTLMWGVGCALGFPVGISAAADNPQTAIRDVAAVSAVAYTAMLLGPMSFGFLGEHIGLLAAFWALVAVALLSALVAGAAREPRLRVNARA